MSLSQAAFPGAGPAESTGEQSDPDPATRRLDLGRLVGVPVMVLLLIFNALPIFFPGDDGFSWSAQAVADLLARILTICFYALFVAVFLRRSPAVATSHSRRATVIAVVTTYLPFTLLFLEVGTPTVPVLVAANALLCLGLCFSLWSLRWLDRSFSIIPQARAIVCKGPYGIVRHPLYTGELTAVLGIVLLNSSWVALMIWVAMCGLQAYRARHEEAILLTTLPDYREYQRRIPQLLPISLTRALSKRPVDVSQSR